MEVKYKDGLTHFILTDEEVGLMAQIFAEWKYAYADNTKYERAKHMESLARYINEQIKNKRKGK